MLAPEGELSLIFTAATHESRMPEEFTHDVFLSHSSTDKGVVRAAADWLAANRIHERNDKVKGCGYGSRRGISKSGTEN